MQRTEGSEGRIEATAELIEHAHTDRDAFGELYDLYLHRVYAFCLAHTRHHHEAEDLTAQTFERALHAIGRYEHRGAPFSSWLFRIAANLATDRVRQGRQLVVLGDTSTQGAGAGISNEPDPEDWVVRWERATWLRSHIAGLPPDQEQALQLRFWGGQSVAEVAVQLNRTENATKQLLHRAVENLRARLGGEELDRV